MYRLEHSPEQLHPPRLAGFCLPVVRMAQREEFRPAEHDRFRDRQTESNRRGKDRVAQADLNRSRATLERPARKHTALETKLCSSRQLLLRSALLGRNSQRLRS